MIGNDIVDLADEDSSVDRLHPRYLDRAFTRDERKAILSSDDLHVALWAHWAAKESAFKAVNRIDSSIHFTPSAFEARLDGSFAEGRVACWNLALTVKLVRTRDWIHAVSRLNDVSEQASASGVDQVPTTEDPSIAVRSLARKELACKLSCPPDRLEISRSRPPEVLLDGEPSGVVLSLSHHGSWIAYAAVSSEV